VIFTWIAIKATSLITSLRIGEEDESEGLDLIEHNETGYQN
jgi:ammonia channel protein AmtB